jgi:hypothetical protein
MLNKTGNAPAFPVKIYEQKDDKLYGGFPVRLYCFIPHGGEVKCLFLQYLSAR